MTEYLYVYGTLRPGNTPTFKIPGVMYDAGWFPAAKFADGIAETIVCERIEVQDWKSFDRYEGYYPDDPANSLYIRRPMLDGFVYEFNREVNPVKKVQSGDWLDYTNKERGINGDRFS